MKFFQSVGNTGSSSTQNIRRANNHRQFDFFENLICLLGCVSDTASRHAQTDFNHRLFEFSSIFCSIDCQSVSADQLRRTWHTNFATFKQSHCKIQGSLPTKSWQHGIGFFSLNNFFNEFWCEWLDISAISKIWISHDCCRV
ncbi:unannotated protein [freshwater metagenome]|uniref:Unannotated protein n=1 Tax=freshwater metagenome TaxID=449393 RepID=A0A6J6GAG9_9ZZZZ